MFHLDFGRRGRRNKREGLIQLGIVRKTVSCKPGQLEADGVVRAVRSRMLLRGRAALESLAGGPDSF